jgi:hypothetical protein
MERLVSMSVDELEQLMACSADEVYELEEAAYPPCCKPPRGRLRLRRLPRGELKVEVERRRIGIGSFQLELLFGNGVCVFGQARQFAEFLRGPVAAAFGIEPEPLPEPERPVASLVDDLRPKVARKKARAPKARKEATPPPSELARLLRQDVAGQDTAVRRIAEVVSGQVAKVAPARPESILLLGPTGSGKTRAIEALPAALQAAGHKDAHVFRIDCGSLAGDFDASRLLGAAPGYVGYAETPPIVDALEQPGCILLLDEVEKAHRANHHVFLGLLDEGRLTAPDGRSVTSPGLVVAMTSSDRADDLAYALADVPPGSREELEACRVHLYRCGWRAELIGRIGSLVVFDPAPARSLHDAAASAIRELGLEYGLDIEELPPVLVDVVLDLADADEFGLRAVAHAARDLLMQPLADAARQGLEGAVTVDPGPPPQVVAHQSNLF